MTTWDATAKDLTDALTARGRRPLDADHLFTCAVEALEDLDDWISPEDLEVTTKELQTNLEEAEKDRDREEKRANDLEKDVERLEDEVAGEEQARQRAERERDEVRSECADLRAVLDGDATLLADQVANLSRNLREERKKTHDLLVQLHGRMVSLQQHAAAPRISKPTIQVNVRDLVGILDRALAASAE
jgi:chromosome segregation ATPase